jgi:integrase
VPKEPEPKVVPTFREVTERYLADPKEREMWKDPEEAERKRRQQFERDAIPWSGRPIDAIETSEVEKLIDGVYERAPIEANRQFSLLRRFFGWAVRKGLVAAAPCDRLEKPARENEGERTLDEDEIRLFWSATETAGGEFHDAFRLLLITAQRESEVGKLHGREVDLGRRLWVIPPERAKNRKGSQRSR